MERAAFFTALARRRSSRASASASARVYGNAASRMSEVVPSDGAYAYGGYPDIDALFKQQARETDRKKREAMLHQIQQLAPRARALRPDLRVHLAERHRAARRRAGADADRPVSVVGALEDVKLKKWTRA